MEEDVKLDKNKLSTKKYWIIFIAVIAVICSVFFFLEARKYQSTDDAYVDTTTVSVSPKVAGQIVEVLVRDNQKVKKGDIVARIDSIDYQIKLNQATAAYKKAELNQHNAIANLNAANSEIQLAQTDVERYERLYQAGAVSKQTLDKAVTHLQTIQAKQITAEQSTFSSDTTKSLKVADAELNVLKAQKDTAELALKYTNILAPIDGTVSSKKVEVGMMVQPGTPLFVIVPNEIWVIANFKETQIRGMKPGMPVEIKIDAYPKKVFMGEIDSIQRSSGAKSSLFPPENAVGSFVKIVQRIPVKIVFKDEADLAEYSIIPGMSVVPRIKTR